MNDSNSQEVMRVTRSRTRVTHEQTPTVIQEDVKTTSQIEKIPVIKNGNSATLCAVKIDEETASVSNTCAFDSLLQIFLTASYDYEVIRSQVITCFAHIIIILQFVILVNAPF